MNPRLLEAMSHIENVDDTIIKERLYLLMLADELGNVSKACKMLGKTRAQFYKYKQRMEKYGLEGLRNLPPIHKHHPQTTPPCLVQKVIQQSFNHVDWGCSRLSMYFKEKNIHISGPTIQRILTEQHMGTKADRCYLLEELAQNEKIKLTDEQANGVFSNNPCWREQNVASQNPGEFLIQDTHYIGRIEGNGKLYMQYIVDTFSSYAFVVLHATNENAAVSILDQHVLPCYRAWGLTVQHIYTDNGRLYNAVSGIKYRQYLEDRTIKHLLPTLCYEEKNGFLERFLCTIKRDFFNKMSHTYLYPDIKTLQCSLAHWLQRYNYHLPHRGYRNFGTPPAKVVERYLALC